MLFSAPRELSACNALKPMRLGLGVLHLTCKSELFSSSDSQSDDELKFMYVCSFRLYFAMVSSRFSLPFKSISLTAVSAFTCALLCSSSHLSLASSSSS